MSRERDPLGLTEHWHVDLRIESELPEDNVVGTRFLINVVFAAVALVTLLVTGWIGFQNFHLRKQISDWEQRMGDIRAEVADVKYMQKEYAIESGKIDQAFALMKPQLYVSGFVAELGRTRPEQIGIDTIDWTEAGIIVRGYVRENSQRAAQLLGSYTKQLNAEKKIGPLFREITLTSLDRGGAAAGAELLNFELTFRLKSAKP
jgi:hypothetical protein